MVFRKQNFQILAPFKNQWHSLIFKTTTWAEQLLLPGSICVIALTTSWWQQCGWDDAAQFPQDVVVQNKGTVSHHHTLQWHCLFDHSFGKLYRNLSQCINSQASGGWFDGNECNWDLFLECVPHVWWTHWRMGTLGIWVSDANEGDVTVACFTWSKQNVPATPGTTILYAACIHTTIIILFVFSNSFRAYFLFLEEIFIVELEFLGLFLFFWRCESQIIHHCEETLFPVFWQLVWVTIKCCHLTVPG